MIKMIIVLHVGAWSNYSDLLPSPTGIRKIVALRTRFRSASSAERSTLFRNKLVSFDRRKAIKEYFCINLIVSQEGRECLRTVESSKHEEVWFSFIAVGTHECYFRAWRRKFTFLLGHCKNIVIFQTLLPHLNSREVHQNYCSGGPSNSITKSYAKSTFGQNILVRPIPFI